MRVFEELNASDLVGTVVKAESTELAEDGSEVGELRLTYDDGRIIEVWAFIDGEGVSYHLVEKGNNSQDENNSRKITNHH